MTMTGRKALAFAGGVLLLFGAIMDTTKLHIHVRLIQILSPPQQTTHQLRRSTNRQLLYPAFQFEPPNDPARNTTITSDYLPYTGQSLPFKLPEGAADWCMPPALPPLDYQHCDPSSPVNRIPLSGGLTNGLKMILLGVIDSYESGRCFYIDESASHLKVYDEDRRTSHSIIRRYFEHIGLHPDSVIVTNAKAEGRVETKGWEEVWEVEEKRRTRASTQYIPYLADETTNGHRLKAITLMRMWRLVPLVRNSACLALEQHGLHQDYMAFSVRRGDKEVLENFQSTGSEKYILAAEKVIPKHFGGVVPKIFVATDDCSVLSEFRALRQSWTFVSQCDLEQHAKDRGFEIANIKHWLATDADRHYEKFMVELLGMAIAKYVVGVTYTNVSWWVLFMRRGNVDGIRFVDFPDNSWLRGTIETW
jgi:hypothetical protein